MDRLCYRPARGLAPFSARPGFPGRLALVMLLFLAAVAPFSANAYSLDAFILSVSVSNAGELQLPLGPTGPPIFNVTIDWGDGNIEIADIATFNSTTLTYIVSHTYSDPGVFTVALDRSGSGPVWLPSFGWSTLAAPPGWMQSSVQLVNISSFGNLGISSLHGCFAGLTSSFTVPNDIPRTVTDLSAAFYRASSFNNSQISTWDVSLVTTLAEMFHGASSFNQPLNAWNVSQVTAMNHLFSNTNFNQSLESWNVSKVTTFSAMFFGNYAFNHPLDAWDVRSAADMSYMFMNSNFGHPLGSWNVRSAISFDQMFSANSVFNQPLNNWDVSFVRSFNAMFQGAGAFNQPLDNWNTSSAVVMDAMFSGALMFNQSLVAWCVPKILSRPGSFSVGSKLSINYEPIWGTCPVRLASCASPIPEGNVTCVDARWLIYANASQLNNSTVITLLPNITLVFSDPVTIGNVTIIIPVVGSDSNMAGRIQVSDCITLSGEVVIQLSNTSSVKNGDRIPVIVSTQPSCFNVNVTTTVETTDKESCSPSVTGTSQIDSSQPASTTLVVVLSTAPGCAINEPIANATLPVALIAGLVVGIIVLAAVIAVVGVYIRRRRFEIETARIVQRLR